MTGSITLRKLLVGMIIFVILISGAACTSSGQALSPYVETPTPGLIKIGLDFDVDCTLKFTAPWPNSVYGSDALVAFEWLEQAGPGTYYLDFSSNAGYELHVKSEDTSYIVDMAGLPEGNFFTATVSAISEKGIKCSDTVGFVRPSGVQGMPELECTLKFTSPSQDGVMFPDSGGFNFLWSGQDNAIKYVLELDFPGNAQVVYDPTESAHKLIYLENLEPEGTYVATVSAYDYNDDFICSAQISFYKKGYTKFAVKSNKASEDDPAAPTQGSPFFPPIIVLNSTPTPIVIR